MWTIYTIVRQVDNNGMYPYYLHFSWLICRRVPANLDAYCYTSKLVNVVVNIEVVTRFVLISFDAILSEFGELLKVFRGGRLEQIEVGSGSL
jgi:hypothetical protein